MNKLLADLEGGATVITATGRQARHIRWQFDRRQAAAGRSSWPAPDVQPLGSWLENAWQASLVAGGEAGGSELLSEVQSRLVWERLLHDDPPAGQAAPPPGALAMVRRAWALLRDWDIPASALAPAATGPDQLAFARWAQRFEAECRDARWLDPGHLNLPLNRDLRAGLLRLPPRVLLSGFVTISPRLLGLAAALTGAGCAVDWHQVADHKGRLRSLRFAAAEQETATVIRWAAGCHEREPGAIIGVVCPDLPVAAPRLRRGLLDLLTPGWRNRPALDLPVTLPRGQPLASVGLVSLALLALKLPEGHIDYRELGQLLRSPFLRGGGSEAAGRARLDLRIREESQREVDLAAISLLSDCTAPGFQALLKVAQEAGRQAPRRQAPADWVEWIDGYLQQLGWMSERPAAVEEQLALQAWADLLERFGMAGSVSGPVSLAGARRLLSALAREQDFQPAARADGIQLLAPVDAVGMAFDALWICGLSSDVWPPPAAPTPLIALALQQRAGIPAASPDAHGGWSAEILSRLQQSAPEVLLSWSQRAGDELHTPSPVLEGLEVTQADTLELDRRAPEQDALQWRGELEALSHDLPPVLHQSGPVRGGSRLLQLQSKCPARAFFELRLGARELRTPPFGIDAALHGRIVHTALEDLYTQLGETGVSPADPAAAERVDAIVRVAVARQLPASQSLLAVLAPLETERVSALLCALLAAERRRPPFKVLGAEQSIVTRIGPLSLRLRLDRLDDIGNGRSLVFDYKTGTAKTTAAWGGQRPAEPQLPLYAVATEVTGIAFIELRATGVKFAGVSAGDTGIPGLKAAEQWTGDGESSWEALRARWRADLERLAEEYAGGDCRIDRNAPDLAAGQFAVLTRLYDSMGGDE